MSKIIIKNRKIKQNRSVRKFRFSCNLLFFVFVSIFFGCLIFLKNNKLKESYAVGDFNSIKLEIAANDEIFKFDLKITNERKKEKWYAWTFERPWASAYARKFYTKNSKVNLKRKKEFEKCWYKIFFVLL